MKRSECHLPLLYHQLQSGEQSAHSDNTQHVRGKVEMRDGVFLSFLRMCCEPVCLLSNFTHCEVYPVQIWAECVLYFENMVNKHGEQGTDHSNLAFTLSGRQIYCSNFPRREFEHFLCFYYNFFWQKYMAPGREGL